MKVKNQKSADIFAHVEKMKKLYIEAPSDMLHLTITNLLRNANDALSAEMANKKPKKQKSSKSQKDQDWWELAKQQYTISATTDGFVVTSNIKKYKDAMSWYCDSEFDAKNKVEQLVFWVSQKRNMGFGSYEEDLENFQLTAN